jgi:Sec-independent protein translocase protein TatA
MESVDMQGIESGLGSVHVFGLPGGSEWIILIIGIAVLLLLPSQLPKMAKSLGEAWGHIRNARKIADGVEAEAKQDLDGAKDDVKSEIAALKREIAQLRGKA